VGSFDGVAEQYEEARRSYPVALRQHLTHEGVLNPQSIVVDLGAGTGQVARLLAGTAHQVIAIEPESDMVRVGIEATADFDNIRWQQGSDADLARILQHRTVDLVVIGNAFHHLNQPVLLRDLDRLVSDGGAVVVCSSSTPVWLQDNDWSAALRSALSVELGTDVDSRAGVPDHLGDAAVLASSPFATVDTWVEERSERRTCESVVGEVVSSASGRIDPSMAARLQAAIEPFASDGTVHETVTTTALTARRPETASNSD
jgi:ubiquinone/menaquinone biosynthesis C-methylase UbiE